MGDDAASPPPDSLAAQPEVVVHCIGMQAVEQSEQLAEQQAGQLAEPQAGQQAEQRCSPKGDQGTVVLGNLYWVPP